MIEGPLMPRAAIAYRRDLSPSQTVDLNGMISRCYEHGTEPMSSETYGPRGFWQCAERHT